jgi:hypothetical protein
MDERLAKGMVRSDLRSFRYKAGDWYLRDLCEELLFARMDGRYPLKQRPLRRQELLRVLKDVEGLIEKRGTAILKDGQDYEPTRVHKKGDGWWRGWVEAVYYDDDEIQHKILRLLGGLVIGTRKKIIVRENGIPIYFESHAIARGLERKGIENAGVYDPNNSPTRAVAETICANAGILDLWLVLARLAKICFDVMIPAFDGGLLLGAAVYLNDEEDGIGREGELHEGCDYVFGEHGSVQNARVADKEYAMVRIVTFVNAGNLFPAQRDIRDRIEAFKAKHEDVLRCRAMWAFWRIGLKLDDDECKSAMDDLMKITKAIIAFNGHEPPAAVGFEEVA